MSGLITQFESSLWYMAAEGFCQSFENIPYVKNQGVVLYSSKVEARKTGLIVSEFTLTAGKVTGLNEPVNQAELQEAMVKANVPFMVWAHSDIKSLGMMISLMNEYMEPAEALRWLVSRHNADVIYSPTLENTGSETIRVFSPGVLQSTMRREHYLLNGLEAISAQLIGFDGYGGEIEYAVKLFQDWVDKIKHSQEPEKQNAYLGDLKSKLLQYQQSRWFHFTEMEWVNSNVLKVVNEMCKALKAIEKFDSKEILISSATNVDDGEERTLTKR